jgi:hypothetical protein
MLRSFIDETGNDPNEPAFCFTGWIARVDEWERFSDAWAQELIRKPAIEYFKHHEAKSRTEQFEGWSIVACDRKILSLASVITRSDIKYGFSTGIRNDVVRNFIKSAISSTRTVRNILHCSRAYEWAFHAVTSMVLEIQVGLGETETVDFIFDEGDAAFDDCQRIYREIKEMLPPAQRDIAGTVSTGNDKALMPLQAADLLAGVSTVNLRDQRAGKAYRLLHKNKPLLFMPINKEQTPFPHIEEHISRLNFWWSLKTMIEKAKGGAE